MFYLNPNTKSLPLDGGLFDARDYATVRKFFTDRTDLPPTETKRLPHLAATLGLGEVLVKDESARYGMNAFKIVGVTFAVAQIAERLKSSQPILACATAGNHGRAVARAARDQGLEAVIYIPARTRQERIDAIAREGARVVVFDGPYDDAVREVAQQAERQGWQIISDTGWPGYDDIPRSIMLGYTHIFDEVADQTGTAPDVVILQAGVGGLACAGLSWFRFHRQAERPFVIAAEPRTAACLQASAQAGKPVVLSGPLATMMEGLRCAEVSTTAWPTIQRSMDAFVAVDDDAGRRAVERLAHPGENDALVWAGLSGACGAATLIELMTNPALAPARVASGLGPRSRVLVVVTEGP
jgi:diaminopropionate ammonia-lyase